jgi:hypothetical protein
MRSVERGPQPTGDDGHPVSFAEYGHAKLPLVDRIGEYCSTCDKAPAIRAVEQASTSTIQFAATSSTARSSSHRGD